MILDAIFNGDRSPASHGADGSAAAAAVSFWISFFLFFSFFIEDERLNLKRI